MLSAVEDPARSSPSGWQVQIPCRVINALHHNHNDLLLSASMPLLPPARAMLLKCHSHGTFDMQKAGQESVIWGSSFCTPLDAEVQGAQLLSHQFV